jgi:biopolymer transport protein ExbD
MPTPRSVSRFSTFAGHLNLTPMIDIVFQLLVFFMVASHLANTERDPLQLPEPVKSQAKAVQEPEQLVINLFSDSQGQIRKIKANADLVRDMPALVDLLLRVGPRLGARDGSVILRADRNMEFSQIEKVLQAIANAGVTSVHIAAAQDEQREAHTP